MDYSTIIRNPSLPFSFTSYNALSACSIRLFLLSCLLGRKLAYPCEIVTAACLPESLSSICSCCSSFFIVSAMEVIVFSSPFWMSRTNSSPPNLYAFPRFPRHSSKHQQHAEDNGPPEYAHIYHYAV